MSRRLRILHIVVQPVLIWDDGEQLEPGPQVQPMTVAVSGLAELADTLPTEVERIEKEDA